MIAYNLVDDVLCKEGSVELFGNKLFNMVVGYLFVDKEIENNYEALEHESQQFGLDTEMCQEYLIENYFEEKYKEVELIKNIIDKNVDDMKGFVEEARKLKIPKQANEENQFRILSFPWCIAGNLLTTIKFLNGCH